jgi:GNAT superfamily N-acetyltransferase
MLLRLEFLQILFVRQGFRHYNFYKQTNFNQSNDNLFDTFDCFDNHSFVKKILLRTTDDEDEVFLADLFFDVRSVEFLQTGLTETQLKPLLTMQYHAQKQSYNAQYPKAEHSIIEVDGEKVGQLLINRSGKNIHLVDISILHNFRGKGAGSYFLEKLKEQAESVTLSVFKTNLRAIRLYEKHKFCLVNDDEMFVKMEWKNVG